MAENTFNPKSRKYGKRNFVDLLELLTPEVYRSEDIDISGLGSDPLEDIVNSHIAIANNISSILFVSALSGTEYSSINTITGISPFFVKQNGYSIVTPYNFENQILDKLGTSFRDYNTSADWNTYASGTLLPSIRVNDPLLADNTVSAFADTASGTHKYLLDNLGLFYILNTSAQGSLTWEPSSYVLTTLNGLYAGREYQTADGIKGIQNHIWRNYNTCSVFQGLNLIPANYVSGSETYTSGVQQLEKLETLIDIIYSPLHIDKKDFFVKDAFDDYISTTNVLSSEVSKGPYRKFLNALGFGFADISDKAEKLDLIYNIDEVPGEYLQYVAELIGWKLFGYSEDRWREQLRNAVDIYKMKGTTKAIQTTINSLIKESILDVSGRVTELWESYIPFVLWYALITDSPYFKDNKTWTQSLSAKAGVLGYSTSSLEENVKLVVDHILLDAVREFPDDFVLTNCVFPVYKFNKLNNLGCFDGEYGLINHNFEVKYHFLKPTQASYYVAKKLAAKYKQSKAFLASHSDGPDGYGVYIAGEKPVPSAPSLFLSATGSSDFVFNYRGKTEYPIPPFEEIGYYKDSLVTRNLVYFLEQKLICFGVTKAFAAEVRNYLLDNIVEGTTNIETLNEFLFFFPTQQTPPNYNTVLGDISRHKYDILSLWNGKSSHLFVDFEQAEIDFTSKTLLGNSKYALYEAARATAAFAPGNAITKTNFNASGEEEYFSQLSGVIGEYIGFDNFDSHSKYTSAAGFVSHETSGVNMGIVTGGSNLGRGGLNTFGRKDVDSILDPQLSSTILTNAPRNAFRRRNFKYDLPMAGYYDRTGFNPPTSFDPSVLEYSMASSLGVLTLGYVPSAASFFPVVDPINPTGVWDFCENLQSTNTYSGIDTSNTFPFRGLSALGADARTTASGTDKYIDRCQTPGVYLVMHKVAEERAKALADRAILLDPSAWSASAYWRDLVTSYANLAIASGEGINAYSDYTNFSFGSNLHKLYETYTDFFTKHVLRKDILSDTGPNIFSHTYGPTFYNGNMDITGSAVISQEGNYIASSLDSIVSIGWGAGSGVFSPCAVQNAWASGTNAVYGPGNLVLPLNGENISGGGEYRNPHILSGIEFVQTSGATSSNEFQLIKLSPTFAQEKSENYLIDNLVIKCKSMNGLPRIRYDMSAGYGGLRNPLVPDSEYRLTIPSLVASENTGLLGGGSIGVWIHTTAVNNLMWSFTKDGVWKMHKESELSIKRVLNELSLRYTYPLEDTPLEEGGVCLANTLYTSSTNNPLSLESLTKDLLHDVEFTFNTKNYTKYNNYEKLGSNHTTTNSLFVPTEYYRDVSQLVHTKNQEYVVEVFFIPENSQNTKYLLLDSIGLQNLTMAEQAGVGLGFGDESEGVPFRPFINEARVSFNKEDLRTVLKFFNSRQSSQYGSREAMNTSSIMNVSGGSRLNYRLPTSAVATSISTNYQSFSNLQFKN